MGGFLVPTRSLNAGGATQVVGASHAVSALGILPSAVPSTPRLSRRGLLQPPRFDFDNGNYGDAHVNGRIYEVAATYVVQGPHHGFLATAVEAGAGLMTILPTDGLSSFRRATAIVGATTDIAISRHVAIQAAYRLQIFHAPDFQLSGSAFPLPTPVNASTLISNEPSLGITYRFSRR
jgi:hypothetical protein